MNKKTILALTIGFACLSSQVNARNQVADARGNAMGNTGVASANYLLAPFYNPALVASADSSDDFAILLPALAISARDSDDSLSLIDDLQSSIEDYENSNSSDKLNEINTYLDQLNANSPLTVSANLGVAVAVPNKVVSSNLYARGYIEIVASTDITQNDYNNSYVDLVAFGYSEVGLALAKDFMISEQKVSIGFTPKYQQMKTYAQRTSVEEFDIEDYDESEISKNAFNMDLGVVWHYDNFRAGLSLKDLLAQKITVDNGSFNDVYKLDTQATLGLAYTTDFVTVAFDADLTQQTRFQSLNDDTQFVRIGVEGNLLGWAQLRAGYEMDLEDTLDNAFTAGIGFSPFDIVHFDIAGSYSGENQFGVSTNLALTF
ncbi:conjugal transfer protein TraF [Psychromonas sp. KJ10-10]|uniref:conjugal transfer protein TraF n=1 Tax=Psychromonas sp. KJ10-10 TaxID=3391823 RepID=UPI0039B6CEAF